MTPATRWRVAAAMALFALAVVAPVVTNYNAQPASRYALTAAVAEHATVDLGRYDRILGIDRAIYDDELRSDKPPGQPLLGVPVYLVGRVLGIDGAAEMRASGDLGLWWQALWGAMVPFAVTVALMYVVAARFAPRAAVPAALAIGFGTIMLPHAASLYGHALAALLGYAAWCMLDRSGGSRRQLAFAGLLAAGAISVEYHTAIVVAVVGVVAIARWKRHALWCLVGAVPPALMTAIYHRAAFGHAWRLPYEYYAGELGDVPTTEGGYALPSVRDLVDVVAGRHGLLFVSPVVLVALVAAYLVARGRGTNDARTHSLVALAVFVPYALLVAGWSGTPLLEEPGPRYLIPALPFLAVPLAVMWDRCRPAALVTSVWGAAVCAAGTVTLLFVAPGNAPFHVYFERVARFDFNPTVWSMAVGPIGAVVYVAVIAIAAAILANTVLTSTNRCSTDLPPTATLASNDRRSDPRPWRP
jgi:hypothetical protein